MNCKEISSIEFVPEKHWYPDVFFKVHFDHASITFYLKMSNRNFLWNNQLDQYILYPYCPGIPVQSTLIRVPA